MVEFSDKGNPLTHEGLARITRDADVGLPEIWAVVSVEAAGCGFLPDRRPKLLFERHIFHRLTSGRFDSEDPDVSQPTAGGYGPSGGHQYERLAAAIQLDRTAALQSASWGMGQVMGMNFKTAGFNKVEDMISAMVASEEGQLSAMATFVINNGMGEVLRNHDWGGFARRYNGPNFAAHNYDGLLEHFFHRYAAGNMPDLDVRTVQIYLFYKGFKPGTVDGVMGPSTEAAIRQFQESVGLEQSGTIDNRFMTQLLA
jgi:hypothetical protein